MPNAMETKSLDLDAVIGKIRSRRKRLCPSIGNVAVHRLRKQIQETTKDSIQQKKVLGTQDRRWTKKVVLVFLSRSFR